MKKGFTIIELLGVLVILATILLLAIPIYNNVRENMNQSLYESKVANVLSKAELYAEETGKMVFDVKSLIQNSVLEADNELKEYKDPRNGRDMSCDILQIHYENNNYVAHISESASCYSEEELESSYGMVDLILEDETGNRISNIDGTDWLNKDKVYVHYKWKEEYLAFASNVEEIKWSGAGESSEERYLITTTSVRDVTVTLTLKIRVGETTLQSKASKRIQLDIQTPNVVTGSIKKSQETQTQNKQKVNFELTDYSGSGVKEYAIVRNPICEGSEFESQKKQASEGIQTEYLTNSDAYYICVVDKVGNKISNEDLEKTKFSITNVDENKPVIEEFEITSQKSYQALETDLTIKASDDFGTENLKVCVSNTGFLQNCSWEPFEETKAWNVGGSLDGQTRTVYLSVQDAAGNVSEKTSTYTVYEECFETTKKYTEEWSSCPTACAVGKQTRKYNLEDNNTAKICSSGEDALETTKFNINSSTRGENGWYKALNLNTTFANGTSTGKYCITTSASCNPATNAPMSSYKWNTNLSSNTNAQKICAKGEGTSISSCTCCSPAYSVDTTLPIAKINATSSGTTVSVSANGSSDTYSGIAKYYYRLDSGQWYESTSTNYSFSNVSSGVHTVYVYVKDRAGNHSAVVSKTVNVDLWITYNFTIPNARSGFRGGNYFIAMGITSNRTDFRYFSRNYGPEGLYTDCQPWCKDCNNDCYDGKGNNHTMYTSKREDSRIRYLGPGLLYGASPSGRRKCNGTSSGDTGWITETRYKPGIEHHYRRPYFYYKYQTVQFADSMEIQYRFIATNCRCDDSYPDSDTPIECNLQVQLKIKFINYKLRLLDEVNLEKYPNATGYLTADNLSSIKPTHLGILLGAEWRDAGDDIYSVLNSGIIVKDISNYFK